MTPSFSLLSVSVCVAACLVGCGGSNPEPETPAGGAPESTAAAETAPATFNDQVALGGKLYGENCAKCHGASGEGSANAPAVVGLDKGALPLDPPETRKARKNKFETVADIAGFVTKNMPPKAPGSLPEEQYWAILAFDLHANGIDLDKKLDATVASTLTVPRK
jgi:mono/diheme cytochrome c family protein